MQISINRDNLLNALVHVQGVIEKKNTLPILSNVLLEANSNKLVLTSTDLDMIFINEINKDIKVIKEGNITIPAKVFYEIVKKLPTSSQVEISLSTGNKLNILSGSSKFNLLCLPAEDFPLSDENFEVSEFTISSKKLLKLIDKTKFSISLDDTRHYLTGIFFHKTIIEGKNFFSAASTDSHRLSFSSIQMDEDFEFTGIILPKKTIYQLSSLLSSTDAEVKISCQKSKIKFKVDNSLLISKAIDGKFPDYTQVIPKNNDKILEIDLKEFINSLDRVISVSSDRKEGVKILAKNNTVTLSVNNPNSGDGLESIKASFNSDEISISFNPKYLMDISSQIEGNKITLNLKDTGSPALIKDKSDKESLFVVMPMKI